jgi:hypothetical protein
MNETAIVSRLDRLIGKVERTKGTGRLLVVFSDILNELRWFREAILEERRFHEEPGAEADGGSGEEQAVGGENAPGEIAPPRDAARSLQTTGEEAHV